MDNIKNDDYYVNKLLKDIKFIIEKTNGITLNELEENEVLCDSVLFRLIQIRVTTDLTSPITVPQPSYTKTEPPGYVQAQSR